VISGRRFRCLAPGYPSGVGEGATTADRDPNRFFDVAREVDRVLEAAGIAHAVIGSAAHVAYVGDSSIEDLDVLITPSDADAAVATLDAAGCRTKKTDPRWLYKAWMDGVLIDLIFRPPRSFRLTDQSVGRRRRHRIGGIEVWMLAPEDQVLLELASDAEDAPWHWRTALGILHRHKIDWSILEEAARGEVGLRLLALLLYARTEGAPVPEWLVSRISRESIADPARRGFRQVRGG
jgi:hypothetical protein